MAPPHDPAPKTRRDEDLAPEEGEHPNAAPPADLGWDPTAGQETTQVAGLPKYTFDDPTGFAETTQVVRRTPSPGMPTPGGWSDAPAAHEDETVVGPRPGLSDPDLTAGLSHTGALGSLAPDAADPAAWAPEAARAPDAPTFGAGPADPGAWAPEGPDWRTDAPAPGADLPGEGSAPAPQDPLGATAGFGADPAQAGGSVPDWLQKTSGAAAAIGIPADLQLPNMDFSLPKGMDAPTDAPAFNPADLPAHLQLPTFPDLGLGLPALDAPAADAAHPGLPASDGDDPAAPAGSAPLGPPSLGPAPPRRTGEVPPTRRASQAERSDVTAFGAPEDLRLPDLAPPPSKRNLTLISMPVDSDADAGKRVIWPFALIALLALGTAVGVWQRDRILAVLVPKKVVQAPVPPPPTPAEQAREAFAGGVRAYTGKEYPKAIEAFEKALTLEPNMTEAHRSLGIVYATTHEQAKAVEHYRRYVTLAPQAEDAPQVQKIIDDYAKAQAKAAPEEPAKPAPLAKRAKKAKTKRR